jgi:hypothetical protein
MPENKNDGSRVFFTPRVHVEPLCPQGHNGKLYLHCQSAAGVPEAAEEEKAQFDVWGSVSAKRGV